MSVPLKGLALRNYRGIGDTWNYMYDFQSFNFFVGANNSGKSSVLNFVSTRLPGYGKDRSIDPLEYHQGKKSSLPQVAFPENVETVIERVMQSARQSHLLSKQNISKIVENLAGPGGKVWVESGIDYREQYALHSPKTAGQMVSIFNHPSEWSRIWNAITGSSGGNLDQHWIPGTLDAIRSVITARFPKPRLIPAIRQIIINQTNEDDYSGAGLIDRLAKIQSPDFDQRADTEKFDRINHFLKTVTDSSDARIEVPYNRQHLLVHMNGRVLPLSALGTGIHEVVMLAAFCTLSEEEILCIEEPEIHLHPLLQRKLISYLQQQTNNQYLIATHSAAFVDTPGSAVFHVRSNDSGTSISAASMLKHRHEICVDLGYKASDIVQSNAVIWVEGPSDRIYLNHWIRHAMPDLREQIHYSIMFYGGRLLSHLSADDEDVNEFIGLRFLNRNLAILIDSDRKSAQSSINKTKTRIKNEFEEGGSIAWITKGREVENYIEHSSLQSAVKKVVGDNYATSAPRGQFDHSLHYVRRSIKKTRSRPLPTSLIETDVDKVKVSRVIASAGPANLDVLDLRERVQTLVEMIIKANA